ncbi:MAG: AAA family ATPase [Rhodothermales bacterium]|nr:AAA family ATPase [Rhodothermales bacterium]MBO6778941.1 AAA family ATPase [Rhodothermales bacterium]
MDDLFDAASPRRSNAPLADRMRPRTLDEFIGQDHILGPGALLRRAIEADRIKSVLFYGPPGTGKTTLARIIANTTRARFLSLNAVLAGVKDIRSAISAAEDALRYHHQRTILFVDEVHRFNKAQQDALLPHVENGTVTLIGATTENPYFEVIKALVSRSRVFELHSLTDDDLAAVVHAAIADSERGYGDRQVRMDPDAGRHLVSTANGDARSLLNALELAVETTPPDESGVIHVTLGVAEESIQQRAVLYDKEGDAHFDTISAFIKSLRGSDADAALYWLARMVYAGEDPRFILRRMLIFASEDVGLADPNAVRVAVACQQAFDMVGMPEGRFHLAQCCLYLATAPKSNTTLSFFSALEFVEKELSGDVPNPLKDGNRDGKALGHGQGYLYPHAYHNHYVPQQYLPDQMQGTYFYEPSDVGYERRIKERLDYWRSRDEAESLEKRLKRYGAPEHEVNTGADGEPGQSVKEAAPDSDT